MSNGPSRPASRSPRQSSTRSWQPARAGVLAGQRERRFGAVDRDAPGRRRARPRSPARSRRSPCRRRARAALRARADGRGSARRPPRSRAAGPAPARQRPGPAAGSPTRRGCTRAARARLRRPTRSSQPREAPGPSSARSDDVELRTGDAEDVGHEELGVHARRGHARQVELARGPVHRVERAHAVAAVSSARRRSSAASASVSSSSSPSRIASSRWRVSLMRWSVTRFSGKL